MGALIYGRRSAGPHFSEASRLLWLEMERAGLSQEALRRGLGIAKGVIGRWLVGDRKPDAASRRKVHRRFRLVKPELWDAPATKPFSSLVVDAA